jgi:transposase
MSGTAEIAKLRADLAASETRAEAANSALLQIRATVSCAEAMIKELKLEIAKLRRDKYGKSSERSARLLDQLELQLEELEAAATEDALAVEQVAPDAQTTVTSFTRRKPSRKQFPEHLPRERVVVPAPTQCDCCGSDRIVKMGEDVTDTLECHSAPVEGDPDRPGKVHRPVVRKDQPASRPVPYHPTRLGGPQPDRHGGL